jgi:hypothetical protein
VLSPKSNNISGSCFGASGSIGLYEVKNPADLPIVGALTCAPRLPRPKKDFLRSGAVMGEETLGECVGVIVLMGDVVVVAGELGVKEVCGVVGVAGVKGMSVEVGVAAAKGVVVDAVITGVGVMGVVGVMTWGWEMLLWV